MASSSRLKAGQTGTILVSVNTSNRRGVILKTVEVLTNDPRKPRVILTLRADVTSDSSVLR